MLMLTAALSMATPARVEAQGATATVTGVVVDKSGASVPDALVTIENLGTGLQRESQTTNEGRFALPLLPPGRYRLTALRDGFTPVEVPDIVLNVNDVVSLRVELQVAAVGEKIEVAAVSRVNTSPAVGTVIDRQFVERLPLNGRSFQSLILLTPGVSITTSNIDNGQFSVNGQRGNANYFTIDGVSANIGVSVSGFFSATSTAQAGTSPGLTTLGSTTNLVSIDALEEFKIQTSSYAAEFGRQPGGQVTLVTRSGTNQFHGTLFEYFRDDAMDARDWFNPPPAPKPQLRQHQFGGTFSGPLRLPGYDGHDRTFFFFSYEGQRLRLPLSGVAYVPSLRVRESAAPSVRLLLNAYPRPTGDELLADVDSNPSTPLAPSGFAPYNYAVSDPSETDATSLRIDHAPSSRLLLFGRFNESPSTKLTHAAFNISTPQEQATRTRTVTLGATASLSPSLTNELRLNVSRQRGATTFVMDALGGASPIDVSALTTGYSGGGLKYGQSYVLMSGMQPSIILGAFGDSVQRQLNIVDNVSLVHGDHLIKMGIDYRRLTPIHGPPAYRQQSDFYSEADMRSGTMSSVFIAAQQGARPIFQNLSLFAQDTWKLSPRMTLDAGVRWELNPAPREADGRMPAALTGIVGTDVSHATLAPEGTPFYRTWYRGFAPRLGLAYQLPRASGRETVVRGGFGVYYDLGSGQATTGFIRGLPFRTSYSQTGIPYPVPAANAAPLAFPEVTFPLTGDIFMLDPDLTLPYTLQWNVAIEQLLGSRQSVSVSYVASVARDLLTTMQLNTPAGGSTGPRANPAINGTVVYTTNDATADYHSLQTQYRLRLTRGLQGLVSYTWAHAIDEVSDEYQGTRLERGNADFDIRHNVSGAVTYVVPAPRAAWLAPILRNWSIDGIVHVQSGRPLNVIGVSIVRDGISFSARPDLVPGVPLYLSDPGVPGGRRFNPAAFTSPPADPTYPRVPARQGTFGRNVLRELPLQQTDLAIGRGFNVAGRCRLLFKMEAFNVFNHPMFGSYGTNIATPATFGVPASTLNRALGGLSALYQIGGPRSIQLSGKLTF